MEFYKFESWRLFTVKLRWATSFPFVVGTLEEVVKYALTHNRGIDGFYEIVGLKFRKLSKKEIKSILSHGNGELSDKLFKVY